MTTTSLPAPTPTVSRPRSGNLICTSSVRGGMKSCGTCWVPMCARSPPTSARSLVRPLARSEEHTSELQSRGHLVCRLLLEKKKHAGVERIHTDHILLFTDEPAEIMLI